MKIQFFKSQKTDFIKTGLLAKNQFQKTGDENTVPRHLFHGGEMRLLLSFW
jgi:hypothetical protein